jgi:Aspartyl protease
MKLTTSHLPIQLLICVSVATLNLPALARERHCPGNVASVTPRFVAHTFIVIPVKVNHQGPFDFMVDTGSQVTVVDPFLGAELSLKPRATVGLISAAGHADASISVLESLEAGFQTVEYPLAIVHDLGQVKAADSRIRGVLGEDFLAHFDMFIDYEHKMLCLDASGRMGAQVGGERISLVGPQDPGDGLPFALRLVLAVHISGVVARPLLLQLDSGSDSPILYQTRGKSRLALLDQATPRTGALSVAQRAFADMPPRELRIGTRTVRQISFATPVSAAYDMPTRDEDGLLPTLLFPRVFICAGHYVVLDPH